MNSRRLLTYFLNLFLVLVLIAPIPAIAAQPVAVRGSTRSNGTYVAPYMRSAPDRIFGNNWSTKGNINTYTGQAGTKVNPPIGYGGYQSNFYNPSPSYSPSNYSLAPIYSPSPNYSPMPSYSLTPSFGGNVPGFGYSNPSYAGSVANKLEPEGVSVDWQKSNLSPLIDTESRKAVADRLKKKDVSMDWYKYDLSTLLDAESRIVIANKLKNKGVLVDWKNYSLRTLLDMESGKR